MKYSDLLSKIILVLFVVSVLLGCAPRDGITRSNHVPDGWLEASIEVDGLTRWYRLYVPDTLPDNPSLVLYLHGGTLSMRSIARKYAGGNKEWIELADREGFILLVPNGVNANTGDTYGDEQNWNDVRPDSASGQTGVDDTAFLLILLDIVSSAYQVDQDRIYVTGASNGGLMTYRLLIEAPERFAAGAAFIANLPDPMEDISLPDHPAPLMIANGTEDPLMPWDGGVIAKDRGFVISADETVEWWVYANQALSDQLESRLLPEINPDDGCQVRMDYYPAPEGGAPVLFYAVIGGGHTIPSIDHPGLENRLTRRLFGPVCHEVEANLLAWNFFQEVDQAGP